MGFWDKFLKPKLRAERLQTFQELGGYKSTFAAFGGDIYKSETVRAAVRPLCRITAKANAKCTDKDIENLLNRRPNPFMNGSDFLYKVRAYTEIKNTAFVLIIRDDRAKVTELYPVPYKTFEALQNDSGRIFIKFHFASLSRADFVAPIEDLVITRKDYLYSDIAGEDNEPLLGELDVINTTKQGVANAVKATSNLRGILKSTKAMLNDEDILKQKEKFVRDYLNLENEGGIASLDSTQEFTPISMNPTVVNAAQMKEFREDVYRYYGVNDNIVMSHYTEAEFEYFYESCIEPFLITFAQELTSKIFSNRQLGFGNTIVYEANKLKFASTATKLSFIQLVDRGAMTPNELRDLFNLEPIDGGNEPIRRLDTAAVNEHNDEAHKEAVKNQEEENEE